MKIRENQSRGMSLEEATDAACQYCIEHDILKKFLLKSSNECSAREERRKREHITYNIP
jgi:hypothetical protein